MGLFQLVVIAVITIGGVMGNPPSSRASQPSYEVVSGVRVPLDSSPATLWEESDSWIICAQGNGYRDLNRGVQAMPLAAMGLMMRLLRTKALSPEKMVPVGNNGWRLRGEDYVRGFVHVKALPSKVLYEKLPDQTYRLMINLTVSKRDYPLEYFRK